MLAAALIAGTASLAYAQSGGGGASSGRHERWHEPVGDFRILNERHQFRNEQSGYAGTYGPRQSRLPNKLAHRAVEPFQRQRIHSSAHQLAHHDDGMGEVPLLLRYRV